MAHFSYRFFCPSVRQDRLRRSLGVVIRLGGRTIEFEVSVRVSIEALLSPAMPSTTARAAGVFIPVIKSLDPRTQEYLVGQQLQGTGATSAFLMSGAAQNFLCMQIAVGMGIPLSIHSMSGQRRRLSLRLYVVGYSFDRVHC